MVDSVGRGSMTRFLGVKGASSSSFSVLYKFEETVDSAGRCASFLEVEAGGFSLTKDETVVVGDNGGLFFCCCSRSSLSSRATAAGDRFIGEVGKEPEVNALFGRGGRQEDLPFSLFSRPMRFFEKENLRVLEEFRLLRRGASRGEGDFLGLAGGIKGSVLLSVLVLPEPVIVKQCVCELKTCVFRAFRRQL
jgi:hypothetical protein